MKISNFTFPILLIAISNFAYSDYDENLGLPSLFIPINNPITEEKVKLGKILFNDSRFSKNGQISCATCHNPEKAYTDSPLQFAKGIYGNEGNINTPTLLNAAFYVRQFRDERSTDLENQALHPFIAPKEMGLKDYKPILRLVSTDKTYKKLFKNVFNILENKITMGHVTAAIATFERTIIAGNSRFDRWYFKGEETLNKKEIEGFNIFMDKGKCVSCHTVEKTSALFTDNKFHNIGVGINLISQEKIRHLTHEFLIANNEHRPVDQKIIQDPNSSHLGRFVPMRRIMTIGGFKTSNLRNVALTAPYMHDGSLKTLEEVVEHYNRGGASSDKEKINDFISSAIKPLNLTPEEKESLVAFLKSLTSKEFEK